MWKIENNGNYYYVSHNGGVSKYCSNYYLTYHKGVVYINRVKDNNNISDTHQLIRNKEFQELIFNENYKELNKFLSDVGFHGVMFLTNDRYIIAISRDKSMYIHDFNGILIFSNELLDEADRTYRKYDFIFRIRTPYTSLSDVIIKYDVKNLRILRKYDIEGDYRDYYFLNYRYIHEI